MRLDARYSTGLSVIDALLGGKEQEAREKFGDTFTFQADGLIFSPDLSVREYDIAVILGNALDNAIEACEKAKGEPFIELSSERRRDMLMLGVRNSFAGTLRANPVSGLLLSDKRDASEHGIGLSNIKMTAEKYHGAMD